MTTHPAERFAIVPLSTPGPTPEDAIVVGDLREVTSYIRQSIARQDAVDQLERARFSVDQIAGLQEKTRGVQVSMVAEAIKHLDQRLDALQQRRADSARERKRRDEEEDQRRIQAELDQLPDPDDPNAASKDPEPSLALEDEEHAPPGDPSVDPAGDTNGDLPDDPHGASFLPPVTDEVEFPMGEAPDLDPDLPRAPIAAGFDEA